MVSCSGPQPPQRDSTHPHSGGSNDKALAHAISMMLVEAGEDDAEVQQSLLDMLVGRQQSGKGPILESQVNGLGVTGE